MSLKVAMTERLTHLQGKVTADEGVLGCVRGCKECMGTRRGVRHNDHVYACAPLLRFCDLRLQEAVSGQVLRREPEVDLLAYHEARRRRRQPQQQRAHLSRVHGVRMACARRLCLRA